jgi:hypothetical protein
VRVGIPALAAQQANVQKIDIGGLSLGPIAVGQLVVTDTRFAMNAAGASLRDVSVTFGLNIKIRWTVDVELFSDSGTEDLGTVSFDVPLPDLPIGPLDDIRLNIPTLTAQAASVQVDPLSLSLGNVTADRIGVTGTTLPTGGFAVGGVSLTSVEGDQIDVPAAAVDSAGVAHLHGDVLTVPNLGLRNVAVPDARIPTITNAAPLTVPLNLGPLTPAPGIDIGILSVALLITPVVRTRVGRLDISDVTAAATVGQVTLRDITLPYDATNLTLSQLGINTLAIPSFAIS